MPTYERRCESCKLDFEAFTSMSKSEAIACPQCNRFEDVVWAPKSAPAMFLEVVPGYGNKPLSALTRKKEDK